MNNRFAIGVLYWAIAVTVAMAAILKGLTGSFTFTWTSTFTDTDQGMFTGHTQDLSGSYQIP